MAALLIHLRTGYFFPDFFDFPFDDFWGLPVGLLPAELLCVFFFATRQK